MHCYRCRWHYAAAHCCCTSTRKNRYRTLRLLPRKLRLHVFNDALRKVVDWKGLAKRFFKRYYRLGARKSQRLQFVVYYVEQVRIVLGMQLYEHVVLSRRVMTLYNFGDFLQLVDDLLKLVGTLEVQPHICTRLESYLVWVDKIIRFADYPHTHQPLHPLVYSSAGDTAFARYFKKGHARILRNHTENLVIQLIQLLSCHKVSI